MAEAAAKFACGGCERKHPWKMEFAGRRIKCKCGHVMVVPPQSPSSEPADELYDLADLADDAKRAAAALPPTIVDPAMIAAPARAVAKSAARSNIPLAYQRPPSAREIENAASSSHIDINRDVKAPLVFLIVGAALYIGYYAIHYNLGGFAIVATGIGLTVMTILETIMLVAFALVVAGPLGVSFGGVGTAILKLASIAVFCDGITTWVDGLFSTYTGGFGGGVLGFGAIGFPIALGVYWGTLIYLFSMDPGDSWMVVVILSIFYRIVRIVLLLLLLRFILSLGHVAASSVALPATGSGTVAQNPVIDMVNEAKAQNTLHEARKFVKERGRSAESGSVEAWYAAGCKNVWFQTDRDINGKGDAFQMVVELPADKDSRAKCYDIGKTYCKNNGRPEAADELKDVGDPYLLLGLP